MSEEWNAVTEAAQPVGVDPGNIVSQSFGIYFRNLVPFTIIMAVVTVPTVALSYLYVSATIHGAAGTAVVFGALGMAGLGFALSLLGSGAIIFGVFRQIHGARPSTGEILTRGVNALVPVLGVALASGLLIVLGLVALVIPGVILVCALYVAVPVAVVEGAKVGDAIRRSFELTRGSRMRIFGILVVLGIANGVLDKALQILILDNRLGGPDAWIWYLGSSSILDIVFGAVGAVASALVFYQLKVGMEGVDAEELAAVFD